jgi:2-alkyl-3-oxoalkanoate reductase
VRILIVGATGVLGRRLVRQLTEAGHEVVGIARNERGEKTIEDLGGKATTASMFDPEAITGPAQGCDVIIHAATAIPKKQKPSKADWEINDRIRVEGTRALTEVASRVGASQFIFQSVAWVARPDDQSAFDENSPANPDEVIRSAVEAGQMALEAAEKHGFTTTVLRGGWFYGPDAWHTRSFGEAFRKRMLPIVGSGEAYWSILHVDDAASAYVTAVEQRPAGIYHVVDGTPVQVRDFFNYFAERLGAPPPRRVPAWLARLLAGKFAASFATTSTITNADRFREATGWQPQYPSYREGIDQIVSAWEAEGFPGR